MLLSLLSACMPEGATPPGAIGSPNPASAHCVNQGGRLEIRRGPDGEAGFCHLPDGRVIEEWQLFRAAMAR